jgi:pantoate--beta-alanine ligase
MASGIPVLRTIADLRARVRAWRAAGETVGLVPTMGALHEGHLELVRLARSRTKRAVVSIFVNPAQFAPHEDFDRYPRDEAGDLAKLAEVGCGAVWSPARGEMYAEEFATRVVPAGAAEGLRATSARISSAVSPPWSANCLHSAGRISRSSAKRTSSNCGW